MEEPRTDRRVRKTKKQLRMALTTLMMEKSAVSYTHLDVYKRQMHSRSGSSSLPPTVTQAHSGAKPSTWSFSFWSRLSGMSMGMETFVCPVSLNFLSSAAWMFSQIA